MALITTLEQLLPHLPIAYSKNLSALPSFDAAEQKYLLPVLGAELYAEISSLAANAGSDEQKALIQRCRAVSAPFAYVDNLPFIQTLITSNGIIAMEADGSRKAYKWEYNAVVRALEDRGYGAIEALIVYLQSHRDAFPNWQTSPYNEALGFGLIRNGAELFEALAIAQPQRCYMLLKPLFETQAELYIAPYIGNAFYRHLNAAAIAGTLTAEERVAARHLRFVLARRVMQAAAVELSISFGNAGFTVLDAGRTIDNPNEGRTAANDMSLQRFINQMDSMATTYMQAATKYLNDTASATVFLQYFASVHYINPALPVRPRNDNGRFRGIFVAG